MSQLDYIAWFRPSTVHATRMPLKRGGQSNRGGDCLTTVEVPGGWGLFRWRDGELVAASGVVYGTEQEAEKAARGMQE